MAPSYELTAGCGSRTMNLWDTFAARVAEDRSAPALLFDNNSLSFGELHAIALRYATALAAHGIERNDVVALQLPKKPVAYGLLLACMRLGAPYVFIDPKSPPERAALVIERVRPKLLFTAGHTVNPHGLTMRTSGNGEAWLDCAASSLPPGHLGAIGTDPAYIMFTSGSTGEPKGAVIPHQGILNLMKWAREKLGAASPERFTNINPLHFDNSVFDIYCGLLNGAALAPIETSQITNPAVWVKAVRKAEATVLFAVPTFFLMLDQLGLLTPSALPTVRTFIFGGEGYPIGKLRGFYDRFSGSARLVNVYGPTETSCICTSIELRDEHLSVPDKEFPPLGRMHDNFSHLILDENERAVARGEVGELWIGGPCVGLGYYSNREETVRRFCQDPRQDHYRSIYYRSGDLVREDEDGKLWFHGRVDNQVKVRGYRVELEEIDLAVQSIRDVSRAVTVLLSGADGDELAVAFAADRMIETDEVRAMCKQKLPGYMQPSRIIQLSDLPRNANGKVDRRATRALLQQMACP
jgi:D-alanine--poly(phosphoribitol) ligase subunit 1